MLLTPEQKQLGLDNFNAAVGATRRDFLIGTMAAGGALGAAYFGYEKLKGDRVKVGFIGTGDEGSVLLSQHPADYMEIVAIADLRPTNRKRAFLGDGNDVRVGLNKKLGMETCKGIKVYSDHRELLKDPSIEAVVIAVPLCQHAEVAMDALKAGKHVLAEKLMAHNVTQCKEMIKTAIDQNKLLAVGHQRHYNVIYDNANHLLQSGMLGDVKHIRALWHRNNSYPGSDSWRKGISKEDAADIADKVKEFGYESMEELVNWRLYNKTGGGLMAELGSHQLDACSIFLGKKHPIAVMGYGGRNFYGVKGVGSPDKQADKREIDDHVYVTMEFPGRHYEEDKNDIVIVTYSSLNTNSVEPYGETVYGSRGTLIIHQELESMLYKEPNRIGVGGVEQRLYVIGGDSGGPALEASASAAPGAVAASTASAATSKKSRGYTEEMEHFCHAIRTQGPEFYPDKKPLPVDKGGLRCNGIVAMGDAIMALTCNLAMKHRKRIEFKEEWFDPNSPAVPENDPQIVG
jgi:predicted dehydrogenase